MLHMSFMSENNEVFNRIIPSTPVYMVDNFSWLKLPTHLFRDDLNVLHDTSIFISSRMKRIVDFYVATLRYLEKLYASYFKLSFSKLFVLPYLLQFLRELISFGHILSKILFHAFRDFLSVRSRLEVFHVAAILPLYEFIVNLKGGTE